MWNPEVIERMDDEEIENCIMGGGLITHLIPTERFSSKKIAAAAFRVNPRNLSYIPREFWTNDMKMKILNSDWLSHYIHDGLFTPGLVRNYLDHDIFGIKKIPHQHQTMSAAIRAVKRDFKLLLNIDPKYLSTIFTLALESDSENGGYKDIKRAFTIDLSLALSYYNDVLLGHVTSLHSRALCKVYHYRLSQLEPEVLSTMAKGVKAFDAYRELTSTASAIGLMDDLGKKRQWIEDDLNM
jgi:hypothetical protein